MGEGREGGRKGGRERREGGRTLLPNTVLCLALLLLTIYPNSKGGGGGGGEGGGGGGGGEGGGPGDTTIFTKLTSESRHNLWNTIFCSLDDKGIRSRGTVRIWN